MPTPATLFDVLHIEPMRVAWVDADAGGRIHWAAVFRWAELAVKAVFSLFKADSTGGAEVPPVGFEPTL